MALVCKVAHIHEGNVVMQRPLRVPVETAHSQHGNWSLEFVLGLNHLTRLQLFVRFYRNPVSLYLGDKRQTIQFLSISRCCYYC